jgi:hypothetical protein
MSNIQSPPGYLNISELLITLKTKVFAMQLFNIVESDDPGYEKVDNCMMFAMHDSPDVSILDDYLQKDNFPVRIQLAGSVASVSGE